MEAFNREEAKELILKECGLVMGGDIHTTLPDGEVRWNFDTHPEKQIGKKYRNQSVLTSITSDRLVVYCLLMCSHLRCQDLFFVPCTATLMVL